MKTKAISVKHTSKCIEFQHNPYYGISKPSILTWHLVKAVGGFDGDLGVARDEKAFEEGKARSLPNGRRTNRHRHRRPIEGRFRLERGLDPLGVTHRRRQELNGGGERKEVEEGGRRRNGREKKEMIGIEEWRRSRMGIKKD